jgi:gamma-glutamyltranspeptidase/glutathione hydrolase
MWLDFSWWPWACVSVALAVTAGALGATPSPVVGRGVVAADSWAASLAGAEILDRGGNASDAAVAAALASGVVHPAGSGLGGGGFAVSFTPQRGAVALDFREVAPRAVTPELFRRPDGTVDTSLLQTGGLAVATPSESRGLARILRDQGSMRPADVAAPAIRLANQGFEVGAHLARALAGTEHPQVRSLFTVGGVVAGRGIRVKNPALGKTIARWAASQGEDLHTGSGARAVAGSVTAAGGVLSAEDLASVAVKERKVIQGKYGEYTIYTMPPPSSGGVALVQVLGALDGYDLAALGHNSADYLHLLTEVMKHAYADRARHLGDPDFVQVPVDTLLSKARIDAIRQAVWPGRTFPSGYYGPVAAPPKDAGTLHISVLDREGRAIALTTTINTSFGSGLVPAELGLILNDQMDDFSAAPGVPNAYGLVGDAANAIAPGKRPLSSMTPTVVVDGAGQVVLVLGASGGSTIISSTLQVLLNILVFGMDPQAAVSAPRIHHQWIPDTLSLEPEISLDTQRLLQARGHTLSVHPGFSAVQAVQRLPDGTTIGGSDPRKDGWPAGAR